MRTLLALLAAASLALTGCGGDDAPATDEPDATETVTDGDAAGGTTMRVHTVDEIVSGDVTNPVHVSGLLIDDGSGWRLCAATLESYPPQCGQPSLVVEQLDESEFDLEEASGVRWVEGATLVGDVQDETLTVTGSATSS